ncbi:MAG: hypothetical protein WBL63_20105, partial [Candidatus Acidiferrum sp.]
MVARLLSSFFALGMLAMLCPAQAQDPPPARASAPAVTSPSSDSTTATPKKVWTNENLSETKGSISVVGDRHNEKYRMGPS